MADSVAVPVVKQATKDEEAEAGKLKDQGNALMNEKKYEEAVEKYTAAIDIVPNAIFYCNRASAYLKLNRSGDAVEDCKTAVALDAKYTKAYGRMGAGYLDMGKHQDARNAYQTASDLDPDNQTYKDKLKVANEKIGAAAVPPGMPNIGGLDIGQLMSNPALMSIAQTVLQDPNMLQSTLQCLSGAGGAQAGEALAQMAGGAAAGGAPAQSTASGIDINALLQNPMFRQIGEDLKSQNPEAMAALKNQFASDPK